VACWARKEASEVDGGCLVDRDRVVGVYLRQYWSSSYDVFGRSMLTGAWSGGQR
jgi:hypothetical protein